MGEAAETSHEYAFDVKLYAVVRVRAKSECEGREAVLSFLDAADITSVVESHAGRPHVAEASIYVDDETGPYLLEIDGEEVD